MKRLLILSLSVALLHTANSQSTFQSTFQTGISLPSKSKALNGTHQGQGIHFGNHLDYSFGAGHIKFGMGMYFGYLNTINTNEEYKKIGQSIADKFRLSQAQVNFNQSAFSSTHFLLGPVASFAKGSLDVNVWAKGGYAANEPGRYAVIFKEGGLVNNVYINQAGENKNGLAYSVGGGLQYVISGNVGLQLNASYFGTNTAQVNYNYEREKGMSPLYYTAKNNFLQASFGINIKFAKPAEQTARIGKSRSNIQNNRVAIDDDNADMPRLQKITKSRSNIQNNRVAISDDNIDMPFAQKITKSRSNIQNNRLMASEENGGMAVRQKITKSRSNIQNNRVASNDDWDDEENDTADTLVFTPSSIKINAERQTPKRDFGERSESQLQTVNNYLTGFVYQNQNGASINQCGSAMQTDPIPGVDVMLKRIGSSGNDMMSLSTKTNKDGSFAFNNVAPGNYIATIGDDKINVVIKDAHAGDYEVLKINSGTCGDVMESYLVNIDDKMYVEVLKAHDAGSGLATGRLLPTVNKKTIAEEATTNIVSPRDMASGLPTGKRMHKPYRVMNTDFDINTQNIITNDGKLYAEVITAREAGSGMATGRTIFTGDVDGDGFLDHEIKSPRDIATGQSSGRRMHKPYRMITDDGEEYEIVSPRDIATGQASGRRMHKPYRMITDDGEEYEIVSPRDIATGQASGRRMHKPYRMITDDGEEYEIVSPRDVATGQASGRRMNSKAEEGYQPWDDTPADDVMSNPLYQASGNSGQNPLYEGKREQRVSGSNGTDHEVFFSTDVTIITNDEVATGNEYKVGPMKWMAPESLNNVAERKGWDGTIKGNKNQTVELTERKGWDGTIKGNKNQAAKVKVKGWDPEKKEEIVAGNQKASINTTRSNIKHISRIHCTNGTCVADCIIEINGNEYDAVVTGTLRSITDSKKSVLGIIR